MNISRPAPSPAPHPTAATEATTAPNASLAPLPIGGAATPAAAVPPAELGPSAPAPRRDSAAPMPPPRASAARTSPPPPDAAAAFAAACAADDARKAAWTEALATAADRPAAARNLASQVEALHGKAGQTPRTLAVLDALLDEPAVGAVLQQENTRGGSLSQADALRTAAAWLNLGEVEGPTAYYLTPGRPSDEMRAHFAQRPTRAADFVARFALAGADVQALLRNFHADAPTGRPLAAQLLDLSERVAAMTASRPQRAAMPVARVADILRGEAGRGVLAAPLVSAATDALLAGRLPVQAQGATDA